VQAKLNNKLFAEHLGRHRHGMKGEKNIILHNDKIYSKMCEQTNISISR
jgi:hypothetical protein